MKRKWIVIIVSIVLLFGLVFYKIFDRPPKPTDERCQDWDWDEDAGVWVCDTSSSAYHGHYFYGGNYFSSKSMLNSNPSYSNYKNSSAFKGGFSKGTSGGFGG